MPSFLETPIEYLKGVGPQRAEALRNELDIHTVGDLLMHYPARHEDRSRIYKISELGSAEANVQVKGRIVKTDLIGAGAARRFTALLQDETGLLELIWFQGISWVAKSVKPGESYLAYGRLSDYKGKLSMAHPELENGDTALQSKGLVPVYPLTEGMRRRRLENRFMVQIVRAALADPKIEVPENLPLHLLRELQLPGRTQSLRMLHAPADLKSLELAQKRLKFEELFFLQMRHLQLKTNRNRVVKGPVFSEVGTLFNTFYKEHLPFTLTDAQKKVIKEIRADMKTGRQMNRLLQGDVGSGKTMVALMSMLLAADNGFQACVMAPTEILAAQHYYSLSELLEEMHIKPVLLTGSTPKKKRAEILEGLKNGDIPFLIGTHALIEDDVAFQQLGLVVIDEQHRFGVAQRAKLSSKASLPPHVLVMTATPIPRTLAMTVYGDLDVSVINQLPGGRKPIQTAMRPGSNRPLIMDFIRKEIKAGRQVYYVFPLIEDSDKLELQSLMSGYDMVNEYLPAPEFKYSIVHGKLKPEEKDDEMRKFRNGQTDIMVATTVIEVGVNVPNATVMVIENAERFGLSQLHQLRGRVGRGGNQSYCILIAGHKLSANGKKRLETMVRTTDGFEISKVDLELRGPGEMDGTRQSGILDLKLADIRHDENLLLLARARAEDLLNSDPLLMKPEHFGVRQELARIPHRTVWSKIA
jgi:ATP-dependent DNA helicase RecG